MIVLYIDSTPLVVGGATNGAVWVMATEGELGPVIPEKVGNGDECDGMSVDVLELFRAA